jgi:hypothetical protein
MRSGGSSRPPTTSEKFGDDPRARGRARTRYRQALEQAEAAGIDALAVQARRRLEDLDRPETQ